MDKQYYKQYYNLEREHWWFTAREKIIESIIISKIKPTQKLSILNIGTATGAGTIMLQQFGNVTSIEYDKDCCQFLNQELNIPTLQGTITNLQFENNSFDLVCAFDVIEHVADDSLAAFEMKRVCKKNGYVFCTVPAFTFLWSQHDVVNHHFRRYKLKQFINLFNVDKKEIVFKSYFNFFFFVPISLIRILLWPFQKNKLRVNPNLANSDFIRFKTGLLNTFLFKIFCLEKFCLKYIKFPFGVSIITLFKIS